MIARGLHHSFTHTSRTTVPCDNKLTNICRAIIVSRTSPQRKPHPFGLEMPCCSLTSSSSQNTVPHHRVPRQRFPALQETDHRCLCRRNFVRFASLWWPRELPGRLSGAPRSTACSHLDQGLSLPLTQGMFDGCAAACSARPGPAPELENDHRVAGHRRRSA